MIAPRAFVLVAVLLSATAHAGAPATALSWTRLPGAEACVDAPSLARDVEARIGAVLVTPSHAELSIEGRISPRPGGGWRAVVAISKAGGPIASQRTLETRSADCHLLDNPLALVIALLIDPSGGPPTPPPAATPEVIIREVRVEVPVLVREPWHLSLAARADGELGTLPAAAIGGSLQLLLRAPRIPMLELVATYFATQTATTDLPGRTVSQSFVSATLAACPVLHTLQPVRVFACAGARLARERHAGHGFEQPLEGTLLVPAALLEARIELPLGSTIALAASAGLHVPLRDVTLTYARSAAAGGGEVTIWDAAPVSLSLGLAVVAALF